MKKNTLLYMLAVLAVLSIVYSIFSFGTAFPIVNVKITADKTEILNLSDSLNNELSLMPQNSESVAIFNTNSRFKNYVELEAGGVEVFQEIVNSGIYHPYSWEVRQFNPNEIKECYYVFSPEGEFLGFQMIIPDTLPGADLEKIDLDNLLKNDVRAGLLPDLDNYELFETSSELKESGRRDHVLTYKMKNEEVAEATYRLKIKISGDELTMFMPSVKIPETFDDRYEEMRSANTTIAYVGQAIMLILYGIVGVALALFFMIRKRTLIWKPALKWSVVIGLLVFMAYLTSIALSWYYYDTSLSTGQFVFQQVLVAFLNGLLISVIFFVSSSAGEGLGRQAFPNQIQFWRSWSKTVGSSKEIMRHTIFGYLWAFFMVGFVTFFYWLTNHVFSWWSPADNMMDPNILAMPFPWLLPSAMSLQAGFWEETLFRAVPLAGAILIGKNFKKKKLWIAFALIFQAIIFGAMHANYPQQPAYARIIEMIIPFILYGLIYINWGLLPVIISHFVYDIVLMAMPLFLLSAPGIWLHRIMAILAMLIPLLVVVIRRIQAGAWYIIQPEDLNSGHVIPKRKEKEEIEEKVTKTVHHHDFPVWIAVVLLLIGSVIWSVLTPFEQDVPRLNLEKKEAIAIADAFIHEHYPGTDSLDYKPYVLMQTGFSRKDKFAWEHTDKEQFRKLFTKELATNYYSITYKTFEGDAVRRSETIVVNVGRDGEIISWFHNVPEPRAGAQLEEDEAKARAELALTEFSDINSDHLELVKITPEKRKARTDWTIIYKDINSGLREGDIRYQVSLAGDKVCGLKNFVHSTENWDREYKKSNVLKGVLFAISNLIKTAMLVAVLIFGIIAWTKKKFNVKVFVGFLIAFILLSLSQTAMLSKTIISQYPTSQPFSSLMLILIISLVIGAVFSGFLHAIPFGYFARIPLQVKRNEHVIGLKGAALGIMLAAAIAFAQGHFLAKNPFAISPLQLDAGFPVLFSILSAIENYLVQFLGLMAAFVIADKLSQGWEKKKVLTLILLVLAGFSFVGKLSPLWWVIAGLVCGAVMVLLYIFVLRSNMIYLPIMAATLILLELLQYVIIDPAVLLLPHVIFTAVITVGLTIFLVWGMYMLRILQPRKEGK
ncbi:MAG: hypothetical protein WCT23_05820 [Candidatus Neomarinimicrobiota bacterium]